MDMKADPGPPGTWDCIDPCAILVLMREGVLVQEEDILKTLDAFGWIEDGNEDMARAKRELKRFSGGGNETQDTHQAN